MSWGYKIFLLYSGFVILTLVMVFLAYRQDVPLVADDYYDQELKYQEEINKLTNARSLPHPVSIEYSISDQALVIIFPAEHTGALSGTIRFQRPSDPRLDTGYPVKTDGNLMQKISTRGMQKGYYKLKVYWDHSGVHYLEEKDIIIQ
jgi:hypothetical protein